MAKENVKAFFEALSQNEALQQVLKEKELAYTGDKEDREAVVNEVLLPVAEEAGYAFTLEELKEIEEGMRPEGEVDEDELEAVAGGVIWGVCVMVGIGGGDCFFLGAGLCVVGGWDGVIYANGSWGG